VCVWSGVRQVAGMQRQRVISKSARMQPQSYKRWGSRDCKRVVDGGRWWSKGGSKSLLQPPVDASQQL